MKREEWNEGLNHIDDDIIEAYIAKKNELSNKKSSGKLKHDRRRVVAYICIAAILSAIVIVPLINNVFQKSKSSPHTPLIIDTSRSPEMFTGEPLKFVMGNDVSDPSESSPNMAPPAFGLNYSNIVIRGVVTYNYPDKYYKLDNSSYTKPVSYRLIQIKTLEVISGENVPEYFLYLIPEGKFVDMTIYDSLIMSVQQIGIENYVLRNDTQQRAEAFPLPVFADQADLPELGNIIAFSNGIFDESLWQNESWIYGYQFAKLNLDKSSDSIDVYRGCTEKYTIGRIKKRINELKEYLKENYVSPSVVTFKPQTEQAKVALSYVQPFENGVFSQRFIGKYDHARLVFTRYINGCQTEETVTIYLNDERVVYSDERYTEDDITGIADIARHIVLMAEEYALNTPNPPHMSVKDKDLISLAIYGWYAKVDGKIYGIVKTSWIYWHKDDTLKRYYDDSYIVYESGSNVYRSMERDELVALVGERNIFMGEYNKEYILPQC